MRSLWVLFPSGGEGKGTEARVPAPTKTATTSTADVSTHPPTNPSTNVGSYRTGSHRVRPTSSRSHMQIRLTVSRPSFPPASQNGAIHNTWNRVAVPPRPESARPRFEGHGVLGFHAAPHCLSF